MNLKLIKDIKGQKFGRLTVIKLIRSEGGLAVWKCKCDCGGKKDVRGAALRCGCVKSCGCMNREPHGKGNRTHGKSSSSEYRAFCHMYERCSPNAKGSDRRNYFERGIKISPLWKRPHGFINFFNHVGVRPSKNHSLDRINNDGNYEPGNVRWATILEQRMNQRKRNYLISCSDADLVTEFLRRGLNNKLEAVHA